MSVISIKNQSAENKLELGWYVLCTEASSSTECINSYTLIIFLTEVDLNILKWTEMKWWWIQTKLEKKIALKTGKNYSGYSYSQEISVQTSQVHITDVLDSVNLSYK